eukprot:6182157-Pleurochrysis_carterae.AAC.3
MAVAHLAGTKVMRLYLKGTGPLFIVNAPVQLVPDALDSLTQDIEWAIENEVRRALKLRRWPSALPKTKALCVFFSSGGQGTARFFQVQSTFDGSAGKAHRADLARQG